MLERRREQRIGDNRRGLIKFGPSGGGLPCTISNLTPSGAGLNVVSTFGVPRVFQLAIDGEGQTRHCRVVWTDLNTLGVSFD